MTRKTWSIVTAGLLLASCDRVRPAVVTMPRGDPSSAGASVAPFVSPPDLLVRRTPQETAPEPGGPRQHDRGAGPSAGTDTSELEPTGGLDAPLCLPEVSDESGEARGGGLKSCRLGGDGCPDGLRAGSLRRRFRGGRAARESTAVQRPGRGGPARGLDFSLEGLERERGQPEGLRRSGWIQATALPLRSAEFDAATPARRVEDLRREGLRLTEALRKGVPEKMRACASAAWRRPAPDGSCDFGRRGGPATAGDSCNRWAREVDTPSAARTADDLFLVCREGTEVEL